MSGVDWSNPWILGIATLIAIFIIRLFFKVWFKLVLLVVAVAALEFAYLWYTGKIVL